MTRLFRQPKDTFRGYCALALFAVAYLGAVALILSPGSLWTGPTVASVTEQP